ncbi:hypothetical protein AU255_08195 [Methyloprofundus sedimenti]|uniref:Uncharacterized protein n=2 Tax=Methyloprofundus sedimenti TaxID=1420851 RepID=A0A1V8M8B8_9GAMM|nr:hypothetical protein AU255_08195 [Methyloprofundus sedimenti]
MMSNSKESKSTYMREQPAGFLERVGVDYYRHLAKDAGIDKMSALTIDELPPDDTLRSIAENMTLLAAIIAFSVGALTTVVSVWIEWTFAGQLDQYTYYALYGGVVLLMLGVELLVLFWLGLKTVHGLACLTGHHRASDDPFLPGDDAVPNILARAALEVPDPVIHYLGIDPLKYISKSKLLLVGLLYKAKVILSSAAVKFVLVRMLGKGALRIGFIWVSVPITGIWDAFTLYKVTREARLRLFGNRLAHYLAKEIMTPELINKLSHKTKEGAVRAVANMVVLAQNYHPNMLVLLVKLSETLEIREDSNYDDWDEFLLLLDEVSVEEKYFLLDLLSIAAAFDGHLSRLEKHYLPEAFGELTGVYMQRIDTLKELLLTGQLHAAKALCKLDFQPG